MTHNASHQRASESRRFSRSVPKTSSVFIARTADFLGEFDDSDGLKNRRRRARKNPITHVLISRMLRSCGEVAERLKAAVC
jgi:hypothetical protein